MRDGDRLFVRTCCKRNRGDETLAQISQRGGRYPIFRHLQCQIGQGSEQYDLAEDVHVHCRDLHLDDLRRSLSTQTILWFCNSMFLGHVKLPYSHSGMVIFLLIQEDIHCS